jgi:hypothetical protein
MLRIHGKVAADGQAVRRSGCEAQTKPGPSETMIEFYDENRYWRKSSLPIMLNPLAGYGNTRP